MLAAAGAGAQEAVTDAAGIRRFHRAVAAGEVELDALAERIGDHLGLVVVSRADPVADDRLTR